MPNQTMKRDLTGCNFFSLMEKRSEKQYWWGWNAKEELVGVRFLASHGNGAIVEDGDEFLIDSDCTVLFWGKIYQKSANTYKCYINGADENFTITINRV